MAPISFSKLLSVSRPRFWFYLLGPYALGCVSSFNHPDTWVLLLALLYAIYFTFPANLFLYGVNDVYDYQTDRLNPKKQGYEAMVHPEEGRQLLKRIFWVTLPFLIFGAFLPPNAVLVFSIFLLLAFFYSAPPLRFKTKPVLDSISNVLYMLPGLMSYSLLSSSFPPLRIVLAGSLWCIAMHAYSAVPDISSDKNANMATIATYFGRNSTLFLCIFLYAASAAFLYPFAPAAAMLLGAVYVAMMGFSLASQRDEGLFRVYRLFPILNILSGAMLFLTILAHRLFR